jgi:hypothetical protein
MDSSPTSNINTNRVHKRSMKKMSSSGGSGAGSGSGSGGSFSSVSVRRRGPSLDGHHDEEYMKTEHLQQEDEMEQHEPIYPTYTPRRRLSYPPRVTLPPSPQSPTPVELPYGKMTILTLKTDHTDRMSSSRCRRTTCPSICSGLCVPAMGAFKEAGSSRRSSQTRDRIVTVPTPSTNGRLCKPIPNPLRSGTSSHASRSSCIPQRAREYHHANAQSRVLLSLSWSCHLALWLFLSYVVELVRLRKA